jgi:hypothetical protein
LFLIGPPLVIGATIFLKLPQEVPLSEQTSARQLRMPGFPVLISKLIWKDRSRFWKFTALNRVGDSRLFPILALA